MPYFSSKPKRPKIRVPKHKGTKNARKMKEINVFYEVELLISYTWRELTNKEVTSHAPIQPNYIPKVLVSMIYAFAKDPRSKFDTYVTIFFFFFD